MLAGGHVGLNVPITRFEMPKHGLIRLAEHVEIFRIPKKNKRFEKVFVVGVRSCSHTAVVIRPPNR